MVRRESEGTYDGSNGGNKAGERAENLELHDESQCGRWGVGREQ